MHSRFWTALGLLLTVAMIVLSAIINYTFGHSLGTTEANARIFGAVSVVAVGVMAVLPLRINAHWAAGRSRTENAETGDKCTLPEWMGRWLTERAEPHPARRMSFSELETDFRRWAQGRAAPKVGSRRFVRLLRTACEEVGLVVEGSTVVGLQLQGERRLLIGS